jgi:glutathionylspermidine synthase
VRRLVATPRPDWPRLVEKVGLTYHRHEDPASPRPYWNESACYEFSEAEVSELEKAIHDLHHLLIDVAGEVVKRGWWERLSIPEDIVPMVLLSWENDDFSLYGRFDFAWMPGGRPKMLEYNADTPTALVEAAVAQWFWLQDTRPEMDQFNSIHERLVDAWKRYRSLQPSIQMLDFASLSGNQEDEQTIAYLMDTAQGAGLGTRWTEMGEIGWDNESKVFVCGDRGIVPPEPIVACFKLYPWEFMWREQFGSVLPHAPTFWIEPPWKALLSNKAILALAWELHPGHPNLLPCFLDEKQAGRNYVRKPMLGREGSNITLVADGRTVLQTEGDYGEGGFVFQALADLPDFDGNRPVFGGWVIDHEPAGLGVRESDGPVTDNLSRFVPHFFRRVADAPAQAQPN